MRDVAGDVVEGEALLEHVAEVERQPARQRLQAQHAEQPRGAGLGLQELAGVERDVDLARQAGRVEAPAASRPSAPAPAGGPCRRARTRPKPRRSRSAPLSARSSWKSSTERRRFAAALRRSTGRWRRSAPRASSSPASTAATRALPPSLAVHRLDLDRPSFLPRSSKSSMTMSSAGTLAGSASSSASNDCASACWQRQPRQPRIDAPGALRRRARAATRRSRAAGRHRGWRASAPSAGVRPATSLVRRRPSATISSARNATCVGA